MKKTGPKSIKKRTRARKATFLRAFRAGGCVARSARTAGINRTTHYEWLAQDPMYKEDFDTAILMAKDAVRDELVRRGRIGDFKPFKYKGRFQYAKCERTLCMLADRTTAFADELPEGASIIERRKVTIRGEKLGVYHRDPRSLLKALALMMPEKYGPVGRRKAKKALPEQVGHELVVHIAAENSRTAEARSSLPPSQYVEENKSQA